MSGKFIKIVGLNNGQLGAIRELSRYNGKIDEVFFKQSVWWWRPLRQSLGESPRLIRIPPVAKRGFIPRYVYENLQFAESATGLSDLYRTWILGELSARLEGNTGAWPAFIIGETTPFHGLPRKAHLVDSSLRIDLRKTDGELLVDHKKLLRKLRAQLAESFPWPANDKITKSSYLDERTFAFIELIDRKLTLKETVDGAQWANVTKMVRKYFRAE